MAVIQMVGIHRISQAMNSTFYSAGVFIDSINIIMVFCQLHLLITFVKLLSYLSRQSIGLHISYAKTNRRKNTIKIIRPNKLPLLIRDSQSLKIFKLRIKA